MSVLSCVFYREITKLIKRASSVTQDEASRFLVYMSQQAAPGPPSFRDPHLEIDAGRALKTKLDFSIICQASPLINEIYLVCGITWDIYIYIYIYIYILKVRVTILYVPFS
jgi:hypothetical protein